MFYKIPHWCGEKGIENEKRKERERGREREREIE
jgi:hypothetical protein